MNRTAIVPPKGKLECYYCGAVNPDSESMCPDTHARHVLVSKSDKEDFGQGQGPGPGETGESQTPLWRADEKNRKQGATVKPVGEAPYETDRLPGSGSQVCSCGNHKARCQFGRSHQWATAYHNGKKIGDDDTMSCHVCGALCGMPREGVGAKEAHGFAQTETVSHCPFCGSGAVIGGSDGTVSCEFCNNSFQVSLEPAYPAMPGNVDGTPMNVDGEPDPMGQADAQDGWADADGAAPSAGDEMGDGGGFPEGDPDGDPEEGEEGGGFPMGDEGGDEEEPTGDEEEEDGPPDEDEPPEDDDDDDKGSGPPWAKKESRFYLTRAGDVLSEHLYLKHLAISHADDLWGLLTSLQEVAA